MEKPPNRLRELRKARGMTLEQLGGLVGLEHQTLSRIELGRIGLRVDDLGRFARALGCRPRDILPTEHGLSDQQEQWLDVLDRLPPAERELLLRMARSGAPEDDDAVGDALGEASG